MSDFQRLYERILAGIDLGQDWHLAPRRNHRTQ